jgi:hypothetical protein
MPAPIVIELTPQAQAVIVKLRNFPQEMGQAIKRGMDDAGNTAWREITIQRFSGKGPFPVVEHRLGERTERLKQSLFYRAARVEAAGQSVSVTGTMGSEGVKYFPIHEYGFSGIATVKPFFRKNRGSKGGTHQVKGFTRRMNIPARAPMHTGIEDHKILFQTRIQQELEKTLASKT